MICCAPPRDRCFRQWTHRDLDKGRKLYWVNPESLLALTPENATTLSWWSKLTGLPTEELINFCLAEYLHDFNKDNEGSFPEETLGILKFNDRESAKRTLEWVKSRVQKSTRGSRFLNAPSTNCRTVAFKLTSFKTESDGEFNRVC
jgi:hypothetical protein